MPRVQSQLHMMACSCYRFSSVTEKSQLCLSSSISANDVTRSRPHLASTPVCTDNKSQLYCTASIDQNKSKKELGRVF